MQVDFYQLARDPVERVVPLIAAKAIEGGSRVLIVHGDKDTRAVFSEALWAREAAFLANGEADAAHAPRQPVLLSGECEAANGAALALAADGIWREEFGTFARVILLFPPEQTEAARALWTRLGGEGHALRIFKQQEGGSWREGR
ncbi:DNA polymerase III subunit chi [Qipengyuania sediminis]|uniref:DNA polymerase III subunit chi n=1 Tax=Qipengyuania sediminis TaxID=1532023 RepID=UPI00105AAD3A|nr:DNA polymerase III subunit chi [Qipengyuania sediminis]